MAGEQTSKDGHMTLAPWSLSPSLDSGYWEEGFGHLL